MWKRIIVLLIILVVGILAFGWWRKTHTVPSSVPAKNVPVLKITDTVDSDKDGLTDWYEINVYHTDPKNADTDRDGKNDGEEIRDGVSPTSKENQRLP